MTRQRFPATCLCRRKLRGNDIYITGLLYLPEELVPVKAGIQFLLSVIPAEAGIQFFFY